MKRGVVCFVLVALILLLAGSFAYAWTSPIQVSPSDVTRSWTRIKGELDGTVSVVASATDSKMYFYRGQAAPSLVSSQPGQYAIAGLAIGSDGTKHLAWADNSAVHYGQLRGTGLQKIVISTTTLRVVNADIAISPKGVIWIVWQGNYGSGYDIYFSKSSDNGKTWTKPTPVLASSGIDSLAPKIAVAADDIPYVIWKEGTGIKIASFANSWNVIDGNDVGGTGYWPAIAAGPDSVYAVFQNNAPGSQKIYYKQKTASGWSSSQYAFDGIYPAIAVDKNGDVHVAAATPSMSDIVYSGPGASSELVGIPGLRNNLPSLDSIKDKVYLAFARDTGSAWSVYYRVRDIVN